MHSAQQRHQPARRVAPVTQQNVIRPQAIECLQQRRPLRGICAVNTGGQSQLRASFIAKADLRSLRHIARQRQNLGGMLASEKNRLHKLLTDAGVRLGVVVSDLHGQSARAMVKAIIAQKSIPEILNLAS